MKINNVKVYNEVYFESNILILVNIAKSQGIELTEINFKENNHTLHIDIELEYELSMVFDGFSILVETSNKNLKAVFIREV